MGKRRNLREDAPGSPKKRKVEETLQDSTDEESEAEHVESGAEEEEESHEENEEQGEVCEENEEQDESSEECHDNGADEESHSENEEKGSSEKSDSENEDEEASEESGSEEKAVDAVRDLFEDKNASASEGDTKNSISTSFDSLKLNEKTMRAVKELGFDSMTEIQARTIPTLLEGKNLVGTAKTGSGKTLAFLVPAVHLVGQVGFKPRNGTGALILCPTRELAMQTYVVLKSLMKYQSQTFGIVMGEAKRKDEAEKLNRGVNILVATPGRLLDHMQNTPGFIYKTLLTLIIDEADRMLDAGFEFEIRQILRRLPAYRQTVLFSATQGEKTRSLTALACPKPIYVEVKDSEEATVKGLTQGYIVCPSEDRMNILFTFLMKNRKRKVMIFFSTCDSVQFHNDLFNYIDLSVMCLHGNQKQAKRDQVFRRFRKCTHGTLLCTDVAARGLDIPIVDWIFQYDPPDDPKDYIHRVGRTARGEGGIGNALLLLRPEEIKFLGYLKHAKIPLNELEISKSKMRDIDKALKYHVGSNYHLNHAAKKAFMAHVRAYKSHKLKDVFNVATLDWSTAGLPFGLIHPPAIDTGEFPRTKKKHGNRPKKRNQWNQDYVKSS